MQNFDLGIERIQIYSSVRWGCPSVLLWRELILRPQFPHPIQLFLSLKQFFSVSQCFRIRCTDSYVLVFRNGTDIFPWQCLLDILTTADKIDFQTGTDEKYFMAQTKLCIAGFVQKELCRSFFYSAQEARLPNLLNIYLNDFQCWVKGIYTDLLDWFTLKIYWSTCWVSHAMYFDYILVDAYKCWN